MGVRVSANLIRDVVKALDLLENLPKPTDDNTVELLLDKPVRFYSDNARRENRHGFHIINRYNEELGETYFEVVL